MKKVVTCKDCHRRMPHVGRGLCGMCYAQERRGTRVRAFCECGKKLRADSSDGKCFRCRQKRETHFCPGCGGRMRGDCKHKKCMWCRAGKRRPWGTCTACGGRLRQGTGRDICFACFLKTPEGQKRANDVRKKRWRKKHPRVGVINSDPHGSRGAGGHVPCKPIIETRIENGVAYQGTVMVNCDCDELVEVSTGIFGVPARPSYQARPGALIVKCSVCGMEWGRLESVGVGLALPKVGADKAGSGEMLEIKFPPVDEHFYAGCLPDAPWTQRHKHDG